MRRRRLAIQVVLGLLLVVIAAETYVLIQERRAHEQIEARSGKLLTTFLQSESDTTRLPRAGEVPIRLQNVRFLWSDKVYIDIGRMAMLATPADGNTVLFDDLNSFALHLQQSVVQIRPDVLGGMFNESVFNYPGSKLRDFKVAIVQESAGPMVQLSGKVKVVVWVPFTMVTRLSVDPASNTLVIGVDHLKVLGVPATKVLTWTPMNLENLVALPPNKSLTVSGNRIMVKPFGLFPPPRVTGRIASVQVGPQMIRLAFAGDSIAAPHAPASNYVYLRGGNAQFGHFRMLDTDVLILDGDQNNPFVFSIQHYADMIPKSQIEIHDTRAVRVTMPDFAAAQRPGQT